MGGLSGDEPASPRPSSDEIRCTYARIGGLRVPARRTLGSDIAGLVDDVGEGVTRFRPGNEVYGDNLALMAPADLAPIVLPSSSRTKYSTAAPLHLESDRSSGPWTDAEPLRQWQRLRHGEQAIEIP